MSSGLPHSTTQADEQSQNPGPPPADENPNDLRSRPNDARNDHKTADSGIDDVNYPPQLHAGNVGLGPHYGEQNRAVSIPLVKTEMGNLTCLVLDNRRTN
jgi:hypothetical protein